MRLKLLAAIALACLAATSCSDDEEPLVPFVFIDQSYISLSYLGSDDNYPVYLSTKSNVPLTFTCEASWLTITPNYSIDNGDEYLYGFVLTCEAQETGRGRTTAISITGEGISESVKVAQDWGYLTCLTGNEVEIDGEGGDFKCKVRSRGSVPRIITPSWVGANNYSYSENDSVYTISFNACKNNSSYMPRTGTITIYDFSHEGDVHYVGTTLNITQKKSATDNISPWDEPEAVDMGVSVEWARCNIGASTETELGETFRWGEIEPYNEETSDPYKWFDEDGTFTKYKDVLYLKPEDDVAIYYWQDWRLPSKREIKALFSNCTCAYKRAGEYKDEAPAGLLLTSKTNGNTLFLPATSKFCSEFWGTDKNNDSVSCIGQAHSVECKPSGETASSPLVIRPVRGDRQFIFYHIWTDGWD